MLNTVCFDPGQGSLFLMPVSSANTMERRPLLAGKGTYYEIQKLISTKAGMMQAFCVGGLRFESFFFFFTFESLPLQRFQTIFEIFNLLQNYKTYEMCKTFRDHGPELFKELNLAEGNGQKILSGVE